MAWLFAFVDIDLKALPCLDWGKWTGCINYEYFEDDHQVIEIILITRAVCQIQGLGRCTCGLI